MAAAVIAGSLALAVLFSYQGEAKQVEAVVQNQPSDQGDGIGLQFSEPEEYVNETGKSAVKVEVASEAVSIKRGSSANIEVVAKHLGGANADQSITVKVLPPIGYTLYPPSVGKSTTPEQRYEATRSGTVLAGGIDLGKFMSIVGADQKAVAKNSQQVYSVMISVPKDLPDELLGEIFIPINIEAIDVNGNEVPGLGTGITIEVST
ncbi:MAG: hypothetical protein ACRD5H_12210 [Nitrososphaerales archaeon]